MAFETIYLTPEESAKLIAAGDGNAALVYLYMKASGDYALKDAAKELRMQSQELSWAESLLKRLGLVTANTPATKFDKEHAPNYNSAYIQTYSQKSTDFQNFQSEVSRRLGRPLNAEELKTLISFDEYLKLPMEVVLMALTCCLQKNEYYNKSTGREKTVSMRTLEKECYDWANKGIRTLEAAAAHIRETMAALEPMGELKKALAIDHQLTSSEKKYMESWLQMGFTIEAIKIAYEKTIIATGQRRWPYMNKILLNWHEKNLHTAEQVQNEGKGRKPGPQTQRAADGFTPGQEELNAASNLKKIRDSMKE